MKCSKKDKQWSTIIDIIQLDGKEKGLEIDIEHNCKLGYKGLKKETCNPEFRDPVKTYQDNKSSIQYSVPDNLSDDEQENDNGY